jgi:phytoene synthase
VDDAVDEASPSDAQSAADQLRMWRSEVAACYDAECERRPQVRASGSSRSWRSSTFRAHPFEELICGVEMDLKRSRYQTFDELTEYCRRVASMVGLICVEIFGYRDPRDALVRHQPWTRIADHQHRPRRRHRPAARAHLSAVEDLQRFGVAEEDLAAGRMTPQVRAVDSS